MDTDPNRPDNNYRLLLALIIGISALTLALVLLLTIATAASLESWVVSERFDDMMRWSDMPMGRSS